MTRVHVPRRSLMSETGQAAARRVLDRVQAALEQLAFDLEAVSHLAPIRPRERRAVERALMRLGQARDAIDDTRAP